MIHSWNLLKVRMSVGSHMKRLSRTFASAYLLFWPVERERRLKYWMHKLVLWHSLSKIHFYILSVWYSPTLHYSTHGIVQSDATDVEYQCFSRSVFSTPHLKNLPTHDFMIKLICNPQLKDMFPNLAKPASIGLVVSMSTADCERGFCALSRIKTELWNRLSCKVSCKLRDQMLMSFHMNGFVLYGQVWEIED